MVVNAVVVVVVVVEGVVAEVIVEVLPIGKLPPNLPPLLHLPQPQSLLRRPRCTHCVVY
jgi:hypothetical protein